MDFNLFSVYYMFGSGNYGFSFLTFTLNTTKGKSLLGLVVYKGRYTILDLFWLSFHIKK